MATQLNLLELLERPTLESLIKPDQVFESDDWQFIVRLPEDTRFDRKSGRVAPVELAKCLSAFGNGPAVQGGVVAIGIENDGQISGCKALSPEKLNNLEYMGRDKCPTGRFSTKRLPVRNNKGEDDFIILCRVHYVEERLVELTDGSAYCREADRSRKLNENEKQEIRINKGERAFELEPTTLLYPDDFNIREINRFANTIRRKRDASDSITNEEVLVSVRLGKFQSSYFIPNNACALMFARDPQLAFPGGYIHFLRFDGKEEKSGSEYNVIKDRIIQGTIPNVIIEASAALDANLREFTAYRDGKFFSVPEYPHDAWYEAIVNACVHRSYHAKTEPIYVKLFDDHLVVQSPGAFMPSVTPENLFHKPRNPFLMLVLRELGEVRCIGEGTKRIKREINDAKLPAPLFVGTQSHVFVTFYNDIANRTNSLDSEAYKALGEVIAFSLDNDERRIINYVMEHKKINVSDALRILSTTYWHTAKAKLQRLVKRGILEFISSKHRDPNAFYRLAKKK